MSSVSVLKDTEYEWIGSIPSHWELLKIKYVFWDRKENNNPIKTDNLISLTIDKGVIPHSEKTGGGNKPKEDLSKYKLVYPGDIVLNSMNVIAGAVGISKYFGVVSPVYYMLIPRNVDHSNEYFHHLFRTETFQKSLYGLGNGILIKENEETGKLNTIRMRIPMDKLGNQFIPVPPPEEQKLISHYLDKKTEQIDSLIEKIQRKIELLKEQRTSLINQCVTKGLDPNVEMKDSGVEWIGEIPSGWNLVRLKYLFSLEGGKDPKRIKDENGEFPILGTGGEIDRGSDFLYDQPTLLLGRKGTIDKPILFDKPFWVSDVMYYTIQKSDVTPKYLYLLFTFIPFGYYSYGSTQPSMSRLDYESMFFPIPKKEERERIVDYLDLVTSKIGNQVDTEAKRIVLLKEYRQSLISSVVTGKVRVTEDMV